MKRGSEIKTDLLRVVMLKPDKQIPHNTVLLLDSEGVRLGEDIGVTSMQCQRPRSARAAESGAAGRLADGVVGSDTLLCELCLCTQWVAFLYRQVLYCRLDR